MTTHTDPDYPSTKTKAGIHMSRVAEHLIQRNEGISERDYHDHKSEQLCRILCDLLVTEALFESWIADLGSNGCQVVV